MSKVAQVSVNISASTEGSGDFSGPYWSGALTALANLTDGTTANKFDVVFMDERSVNASSNDDLDLAGVLTNPLGATITFAKVVALAVINAPLDSTEAANVSNLTIGGATNPFVGFLGGTTPTIGPIRPGGFVVIGAADLGGIGSPVAGTGDILRIANGAGGTAKYQIAILGRSA